MHHSFALATVVNEMVAENNIILDLGSMSSGSTGAFLNLKCLCYVEDINEYLDDLSTNGGDPIKKLDDHLLVKPEDLKFDFVLCWDLFNYLPTETLEHLMKSLAPYFKEGTILHTMRHVGATMPEKPGNFKILDDFNFHMEHDPSVAKIPTQSISTVKLLQHMGAFTMRKTLMNQQGMSGDITEHLLEYGKKAFEKNLKRSTQPEQAIYSEQEAKYKNIKMICLIAVLKHISKKTGSTILDAGKKSGRSMALLNSITDNLYVEDVYSLMTWRKKVAINEDSLFNDNMLRFAPDVTFDLVLLWDLFNFSHFEQAERLIRLLERHLKVGAYVHCLLMKSDGVADVPAQFEVNKNYNVAIKGDIHGKNKPYFTTTAEIIRLMSKFELKGSRFGSVSANDNYFEFLFKFKGH